MYRVMALSDDGYQLSCIVFRETRTNYVLVATMIVDRFAFRDKQIPEAFCVFRNANLRDKSWANCQNIYGFPELAPMIAAELARVDSLDSEKQKKAFDEINLMKKASGPATPAASAN